MRRPFHVTTKAAVNASGGSKAASTAALSFAASISGGSGSFGSTSPIGQGSVPASGNWLFTATGVKWTALSPSGSVTQPWLRCRRALCWNSMWRNLQRHEDIVSGGEVNCLIDGRCGERLPAIDLAHVDLTGGEQRPEQHGGSLC